MVEHFCVLLLLCSPFLTHKVEGKVLRLRWISCIVMARAVCSWYNENYIKWCTSHHIFLGRNSTPQEIVSS